MFNEQTYRYPTFMNINFLIPKSIYKNYIEIIVFNAKLITLLLPDIIFIKKIQ